MLSSQERILTTHVGRLERPDSLTNAMFANAGGRPSDPQFSEALRGAVGEVVKQQAEVGIDIVCDGEFGKLSWNSYLNTRLAGFAVEDREVRFEHWTHSTWKGYDREVFADYYAWAAGDTGNLYYRSPGAVPPQECVDEVRYIGHEALAQDIEATLAALEQVEVAEAFMPSTSPGSVLWPNRHYGSEEEYRFALADALHEEYKAIIDAGLVLQIDDPALPGLWDLMLPDVDERAYARACDLRIEAVNHALRGLPRDRVRYHICWGSWHGPHSTDVPLAMMLPLLARLEVGGFVFEAGNVRHEHEWQVWREMADDDRLLIPGVVSHATDTVEHPELVAQRLVQLAGVVGRERVIAGTDCGLGFRVHPQVAWAKLRAMVEGARIASGQLW